MTVAQGRRNKSALRPNKLTIALLLPKFLLIKIGQLPIWLIYIIFSSLKKGISFATLLHRPAKTKKDHPASPKSKKFLQNLLSKLNLYQKAFLKTVFSTIHLLKISKYSYKFLINAFIWQAGNQAAPKKRLLKRGRPKTRAFTDRLTYLFIRRPLQKISRFKLPRIRKMPLAATALILLFLYTFFIFKIAYQLPTPDHLLSVKPLTTEFYDRNNTLLYRLYDNENRSLVQLKDLPPYLVQATLAIEDKNFYRHNGVDPLAIGRAAIHDFKNPNNLEGASTITQQLVKNSLLTPERTYARKAKEIILAFWVEKVYSKDNILQMYFNEVPYGGPAWGVEAASEMYFGKHAKDLDLAQAAYLAGLPASPTEYSPYGTQPQLGKKRQVEVLKRMVEEKYISKETADAAAVEELSLASPHSDIKAPHFVMYVKDYLAQTLGSRVVSQGGLKVYTTLDLDLQKQAEQIVKKEVDKLSSFNVQNGAAMITDPKTGQILAMVGSKDYNEPNFGNYNVTLALRQPGSSIKPITYAAAFKKGYSPGNTILDTPISFTDNWGRSYSPVNYDGRFHGPVSIRTALGSSFNIPAVKLLATIGIEDMIQTARDLGISTFNDSSRYGLSLTLGGGAVKMIDMMSVYGTLANLGVKETPTPIIKVTDSEGNIIDEYKDSNQRVLEPQISYLITSILSDNNARTPAFGPNSLLYFPGQAVAVKTGTSDDKIDNLTFGYTENYVIGVWVGNPDNSPMNQALTSGITGAAPIWRRIFEVLLKDHPSLAFTRPAGISEAYIDGRKDLVASGILPKGLVRVNRDKDKITFYDSFSSYATSSAIISANNPKIYSP